MKDRETIRRIARSVARTAGIVSNDYDEEFNIKELASGLSDRMGDVVSKYIEGINPAGMKPAPGSGAKCAPGIRITESGNNSRTYYTCGRYTAKFRMDFVPAEGQGNDVKFSLTTEVDFDGKSIWSDESSYTMHVTSIAGEPVTLDYHGAEGFSLAEIRSIPLSRFLDGMYVIEDLGLYLPEKNEVKSNVGASNFRYLMEKMEKLAEKIREKLSAWEKKNSVVATILQDIEKKVADHEREMRNAR